MTGKDQIETLPMECIRDQARQRGPGVARLPSCKVPVKVRPAASERVTGRFEKARRDRAAVDPGPTPGPA